MAVYLGRNKVNMNGGIPVSVEGVDTSDATVIASNLENGVIAYGANGKVTGELPCYYGYDISAQEVTHGNYTTIVGEVHDEKVLGFKMTFPEKCILIKDSKIQLSIPVEDLGDATPEDVAVGKTFTSADGLKVVGTGTVGTDVSDATVISSNNSHFEENFTTAGSGSTISYVGIKHTYTKDTLIKSGVAITHYVDIPLFGDATAEDVAAGKTFTSAAGVKVTGTATSSGSSSGYSSGDIVKAYPTSSLSLGTGSSYSSLSLSYGSDITQTNGTIALSGTTGSVTVSSTDDLSVLLGKYVTVGSSYATTLSGIYYIPTDTTFSTSGSTYSTSYVASSANKMFVLA